MPVGLAVLEMVGDGEDDRECDAVADEENDMLTDTAAVADPDADCDWVTVPDEDMLTVTETLDVTVGVSVGTDGVIVPVGVAVDVPLTLTDAVFVDVTLTDTVNVAVTLAVAVLVVVSEAVLEMVGVTEIEGDISADGGFNTFAVSPPAPSWFV